MSVERGGNNIRFRREEIQKIYFRNKLCEEFRNSRYPMPENLRQGRNVAIILGFVEIACCAASLVFYFRRRSRLVIIWILMNWIATALGFYAKLKLSYCGLVTHAVYTISIIGGFYIYIIVDAIITSNKYNTAMKTNSSPLSQTIILILTSVPFLALFIMGCYSVALAFKVEDELEERKKNDGEGEGADQERNAGAANNASRVRALQAN